MEKVRLSEREKNKRTKEYLETVIPYIEMLEAELKKVHKLLTSDEV